MQGVWERIAQIAHDPEIAAVTGFLKYEDLWAHADNMFPEIAAFLYGDIRCNSSGMRLMRAAMSYTGGFRKFTAAGAEAAEKGSELNIDEVGGHV